MNTESTLPPPPPSGQSRNPWKNFGIITIMLVLIGGAVAAGYFLGSSEDAVETAPPATALENNAPPTTAFDNDADILLLTRQAEIAIANAEADEANFGSTFAARITRQEELIELGGSCDAALRTVDELDQIVDDIGSYITAPFGGEPVTVAIDRLSAAIDIAPDTDVKFKAEGRLVQLKEQIDPGAIQSGSRSRSLGPSTR